MRHAYLGQKGRGSGKDSGKNSPSNPTHEDYGTRSVGFQ